MKSEQTKKNEDTMKSFDQIYAESATTATLTVGFTGKSGKVLVEKAEHAAESIVLDAATSSASLGGDKAGDGLIHLWNSSGKKTVTISGSVNEDVFGTPIQRDIGGEVIVCNSEGTVKGTLNGLGRLTLYGGEAKTISLDASTGMLAVGGVGTPGQVVMQDSSGHPAIFLDAANGSMTLGNNNHVPILLDGSNGKLMLGGPGINGAVVIKNSNDTETIKITGSNGDIEFLNADVAEEFEIRPDCLADVLPGAVVVVDESGKLRPCDEAYDGRVVGIVAGAGQYRPGIVLDRKGGRNRLPVAMIGKVYCWVEADSEPVRAGDMLTTSATKGHAKRASDRLQAFGSVIGKALQTLTHGRALIPVLVKPQ